MDFTELLRDFPERVLWAGHGVSLLGQPVLLPLAGLRRAAAVLIVNLQKLQPQQILYDIT